MSITDPNGDQPHTVLLSRRQLAGARMAVLDTLRGDLTATAQHAANGWDGSAVALADARNWSRHLRDTLDLLDALGWPTAEDLSRSQIAPDEDAER